MSRFWSVLARMASAACVLAFSGLISLAFAEPQACDTVTDARLKAAIDSGRQHLMRIWRPIAGGYMVAYRLGGAQPVPLGLDKLSGFQKVIPKGDAASQAPIEGLLAVRALDCTVHEAGPPTRVVVRLIARGMSFREGGTPWTPPLPRGVVQGFEIVDRNGEYGVRATADLRLALPPDARMSLPQEGAPQPTAAKAATPPKR